MQSFQTERRTLNLVKLFFYAKTMVETQSKSAIQTPPDGPPVRVPPKRTFSETQSVPQKQPAVEQTREVKDTLRATQRRRSNPPQARLDAKTMMKLVPNLSERELKQVVKHYSET